MKILIAEDDTFFQKFYSSQLTQKGFDVDVAENGAIALEKLKKSKPDIIILDLIMPEKDGFEVLDSLKKDANLSKIPVLVFSTLGQDKDVELALKKGAKAHINKSFFDFDALVKKIHEVAKK